jgi:hypothetical protein
MFHLSPAVEVALGVASAVMFVGTLVAIPVFLVRVPDDYFARPRPPRSLLVKVLRTALGIALIAVGLAMLVLPGQGLLTILVGVMFLELEMKDRVMVRILAAPKVHATIDRLRRKAGRGPLAAPTAA